MVVEILFLRIQAMIWFNSIFGLGPEYLGHFRKFSVRILLTQGNIWIWANMCKMICEKRKHQKKQKAFSLNQNWTHLPGSACTSKHAHMCVCALVGMSAYVCVYVAICIFVYVCLYVIVYVYARLFVCSMYMWLSVWALCLWEWFDDFSALKGFFVVLFF